MKTMEYRLGAAVAMLMVACLPLFGVGYGALFVGRVLSGRLRKERRRKRCEKIREQRMRQRIALREARKKERRGENWIALRNAKATLASASPVLSSSSNKARINILKNNDFENTDMRGDGVPTGEEVARQWDRSHDSIGEMVRFGLMLLEVEEVTDSSVIMAEDVDGVPVIVGRKPGVRGWLAEHCPHIGYKTAMRYKSLARKALQSKKGEGLVGKSETVHALQESLYTDLDIPHCRLERPRAKRRCGSRGRSPSMRERMRSPYPSLVFGTRVRTHDALRALSVQEAQRLGEAFSALADEVRGAS